MQKFFFQKKPISQLETEYAAVSIGIINIIAIITGAVSIAYLLLTVTIGCIEWFQTIGIFGLFITAATARFFRYKQWLSASNFTFLAGLWLILSYYSAFDGGLNGVTFAAMLLCIVCAGLLVSTKGISLFSLGVLITASILFYLQNSEQLPEPLLAHSADQRWISYAITIAAAAVVGSYTSSQISKSLASLQKQEQVLREQNKSLEAQKEEHKRVSEQLAHSKSLLEATFEAIADGVLAVDHKQDVVAMNQVFRDMWNTPEDLSDWHNTHQFFRSQLKHPTRMAARVKDIYANPESESYDLVELLDGRVYERFSQPQVLAGDITGRVWTYRDITSIKGTEEALQSSEERFRQIFELAPIGMAMTNMEGQYIQANQAMAQILGYTVNELLSMGGKQTTHPEDLELHKELQAQLVGGEISEYQLEKRYLHKDKSIVMASVHVTHMKDEEGQSLYNIIQLLDLTEKKRSEEAMRQAQKLESLGIMSGGIAHDFNNLLTAILAHSSYAMSLLPEESQARSNIAKVVGSVHRASGLTQQLLAYSGRGQFEKKPVDLNQLISDNLYLAETAVESKAVLHNLLSDSLPLVEGDSGQLQQVVMNLIINAAEAIQVQEGLIVVKTYLLELAPDTDYHLTYTEEPLPPGRYTVLEIRDNGIGMDEETLSRIFDPFFSTKYMGRGLGLAAVLGIVRGHDGALRVESQPERGTTFQLLLPATTKLNHEQNEVPPSLPRKQLDGIVLAVDDQEMILDAAEAILSSENLQLLRATNGLEAVEIFEKNKEKIDLILLDLSMPGFSGEATLQRIREIDRDVPVIVSSGYSEGESIASLDKNNITAFLPKPYSSNQLIQLLHKYMK